MHNFDTPIAGHNTKAAQHEYDREWNNTNQREDEYEYEEEYGQQESEGEYEEESENEYENEYENESEAEDHETVLGETAQTELAGELLNVQSEDELDRVVHEVIRRASRRGIDRQVALALAMLLKGFAKKLFRRAGRGPVRGRRGGYHSLNLHNEMAGETFGNETQELNSEDQEFENRRSFIRMAGHAARHAARLPRHHSAAWRARRAMALAARRHAPALWRHRFSHSFSSNIAQRLNTLEDTIRRLTEQLQEQDAATGTPAALHEPEGAPGEMEYENLYGEYEDREDESYEYEEEYEGENYENEYESEEEYENEAYESEAAVSGECECETCSRKKRKKKKRSRTTESENEAYEYEEEYEQEGEYEHEDEYEYEQEDENEFEFEEEFEGESEYEGEDRESTFHESAQMELASELLSVQSEAELDQFLGKLIKKASRFAGKLVKGPLKGMLKSVAKAALPIAGNIIAPGVGGMVGKAASNLFEMEMEGMSAEDREFENAKAFVRFAGNAAKRAAANRRPVNPRLNARRAVARAAKRYAPALLRRRRLQQQQRQRLLNRRRQLAAKRHPQRRRPHPKHRYRKPHWNMANRYNPNQYNPNNYNVNQYGAAAPPAYNPDADQPVQNNNNPFGNDAPLLTQRLSGLENALSMLSERIASMKPAGPKNDQPSDGADANDAGGTAQKDSEYWN